MAEARQPHLPEDTFFAHDETEESLEPEPLHVSLEALDELLTSRGALSVQDARAYANWYHGTEPDTAELAILSIRRVQIRQLVDQLEEKRKNVINLMFGLTGEAPKTHRQIAKITGVTPERIRQLEVDARAKLRRRLQE
jgi:RNA polymerase sigma factor (sigma-70 family)